MRFLIGLVLLLFSVYTGWVVWQFGYTSVFTVTLQQHPSTQVLLDLYIAGSLLFWIMILDNKRQGRAVKKVIPYLVVTMFLGAIGPLIYFLVYPELLKLNKNF